MLSSGYETAISEIRRDRSLYGASNAAASGAAQIRLCGTLIWCTVVALLQLKPGYCRGDRAVVRGESGAAADRSVSLLGNQHLLPRNHQLLANGFQADGVSALYITNGVSALYITNGVSAIYITNGVSALYITNGVSAIPHNDPAVYNEVSEMGGRASHTAVLAPQQCQS